MKKPEITKRREEIDLKELLNRPLLTYLDVAILLNVSTTTGRKIVSNLNEELKRKGFFTHNCRISSKYFKDRFNLDDIQG